MRVFSPTTSTRSSRPSGTVARYASATLYVENFARDQKIVDAAAVSAAAFVASLRSIKVSPNGHPNTARRRLADMGVRYIVECCRSLYRFGIDNEVLPPGTSNPFIRGRTVHVRIRDAKPIFVFEAEQELAFLTAARPWSLGVHFALAKTGLRPGELVHLLIEDVDLTGGWLLVRGKPELGWTTKTATDRGVPLLPELVAVLRTLIDGRPEGVLFLRERFAVQQSRTFRQFPPGTIHAYISRDIAHCPILHPLFRPRPIFIGGGRFRMSLSHAQWNVVAPCRS